MPAALFNILIEQGASFYKKFTFKDKDGNRIDLTGNVYTGQLRKATGDATILATFAFTLLDQTNPLTKGDVEMELTQLQTASLPLKAQKLPARTLETYAYDVECLFPDGHKERILEGVASVSPEVTV